MSPELCKKCNLPIKEGPGITEWCACEVGIDIDENGEPLDSCPDHGTYSGGICYGCEAVDRAIDDWKERKHDNKGGLKW